MLIRPPTDGATNGVRPHRQYAAAAAVAAVALAGVAVAAVAVTPPPAAAFAQPGYSGGTNPEYTGKGASPVKESACGQGATGGGQCGFLTASGGGFVVILPKGFVAKYQGTAAGTVDNMAVIAAMMKLPPAQWAPANISGVPTGLSVTPAYAALLAKVGVTPTQFVDWQMGNVPPDKRMPWVPGWSATATSTAKTSPTSSTSTTQGGASSSTTATKTTVPPASSTAQKGASTATSSTAKTSTQPATATKKTPVAAKSKADARNYVTRQRAVANPVFCPSGSSFVFTPGGDRCLSDTLTGISTHAAPGSRVQTQDPIGEGGRHQQALAASIAASKAAANKSYKGPGGPLGVGWFFPSFFLVLFGFIGWVFVRILRTP